MWPSRSLSLQVLLLGLLATATFASNVTHFARAPHRPSCGNSGTAYRRVAYYQSWNYRKRTCDKVLPTEINTNGISHLLLAFATMDPKTFEVGLMDPEDANVYQHFLNWTEGTQKWLSIGGWDFSNPGATQLTWSQMTSSKDNRQAFIYSLKQFLNMWQFSGIDISWEWPASAGRGGNQADIEDLVSLMTELKQSLLPSYGLSVVLPASSEYLKGYDLQGLSSQVDFFNVLAYDLHGPWDADITGLGPYIKPHTDLRDIDNALNVLYDAGLNPLQLNLGIANYGRGFTVSDTNCMAVGCQFSGPSKAGSCTHIDGVLSSCEINRIVAANKLTPNMISSESGVKQITFDDQWIGYDDNETLALKLELANQRCLGGTALWAVDYDICDGGNENSQPTVSNAPIASTAQPPIASSLPAPPVISFTMSQSKSPEESNNPSISVVSPSANTNAQSIGPGPSASEQPSASVSNTGIPQPTDSATPLSSEIVQSSSQETLFPSQPSQLPAPLSSFLGQSSNGSPVTGTSIIQPTQPGVSGSAVIPTSISLQMSASSLDSSSPGVEPSGSAIPISASESVVPNPVQPSVSKISSTIMISIPTPSVGKISSGTMIPMPITQSSASNQVQSSLDSISSVARISVPVSQSSGVNQTPPSLGSAVSPSAPPLSIPGSETVPVIVVSSTGQANPAQPSLQSSSVPANQVSQIDQSHTAVPSLNPLPSVSEISSGSLPSFNPASSMVSGLPLPSPPASVGVSSSNVGIPSLPNTPGSVTLPSNSQILQMPTVIMTGSETAISMCTTFPCMFSMPQRPLPTPQVISFLPFTENLIAVTGGTTATTTGEVETVIGGSITKIMVTFLTVQGCSTSTVVSIMNPSPLTISEQPACAIILQSSAETLPQFPCVYPTETTMTIGANMHTIPWQGFATTTTVSGPNTLDPCVFESKTQVGVIPFNGPRQSCPVECLLYDWCSPFCNLETLPPQMPSQCSSFDWCLLFWGHHSSQTSKPDPDDTDPACVPNDCVKDCFLWRIATWALFKRPICPCIPVVCNKPADSKKCKLFGCGCGWMGLDFGPGCESEGLVFKLPDLSFPCGLFGCNPCGFFGCPPNSQDNENGVLGFQGYCLTEGGCDPCPPEICSGPACTLPGGCGPKPGPPPTDPASRPLTCEEQQKTRVTERFVWCTEGLAVSDLPSSIGGGTSTTMISTLCVPLVEATMKVCPGAMVGYTTTTTKTATTTLSSEAPACTVAPLTLDDDEGSNYDPALFSSMMSAHLSGTAPPLLSNPFSHSNSVSSSSLSSSVKSSSLSTPSSSSASSSSSTLSSTSSASPSPSATCKPMGAQCGVTAPTDPCCSGECRSKPGIGVQLFICQDKCTPMGAKCDSNTPCCTGVCLITCQDQPSLGTSTSTATSTPTSLPSMSPYDSWDARFELWMTGKSAGLNWNLYDPNHNAAGSGSARDDNSPSTVTGQIKSSSDRPSQFSLPYTINFTITDPLDSNKARLQLEVDKFVPGCVDVTCTAQMMTEDKLENNYFDVRSCQEQCINTNLKQSDFWCQDLSDGMWEPKNGGWSRGFLCGWKGY